MDYKTKNEVVDKLDEVDKALRESLLSYDTVIAEKEHLKKARSLLQECLTEILILK